MVNNYISIPTTAEGGFFSNALNVYKTVATNHGFEFRLTSGGGFLCIETSTSRAGRTRFTIRFKVIII